MTKEKKIQEAYGKHYNFFKHFIDENGWLDKLKIATENMMLIIQLTNEIKCESQINNAYSIRPILLKGIENNNGWTKLKGIKNEITHEGDIWILNKYGNIELWLESQFLPIGYATHYKPIIKPNEPLY